MRIQIKYRTQTLLTGIRDSEPKAPRDKSKNFTLHGGLNRLFDCAKQPTSLRHYRREVSSSQEAPCPTDWYCTVWRSSTQQCLISDTSMLLFLT